MSPDSKPIEQWEDIEFLTVFQVARILHVSPDTVRRMYRHRDGVLKYGHLATQIHRQYISLRIPAKMVQADIARMSGNLYLNSPKSRASIGKF